ncbi:hypothetical protein HMPREF9332_00218 [Alloprevotella rava F0323]|uniref:Uncharacterized protein n=1 Tax=Alloprevotella rava F0323 TaxID=679199 RepID=G5G9G7_9BACT|nr:hypothetical protein [Alloprevotella rava]EHG24381.1 hypothetical protein HMPREF9332_00218 [Alloprevotella rava F0323]
MKQITSPITLLIVLLMAAISLTSCMEDYNDPDSYAEMVLSNRAWRVVSSTNRYAYVEGDVFYFYRDGSFQTLRRRGLSEYGQWMVRKGNLLMHFTNSSLNVDIEAPIPVLQGDYAVLYCNDYMYRMSYNLRLVAAYDLSGYGHNHWYNNGYYSPRE